MKKTINLLLSAFVITLIFSSAGFTQPQVVTINGASPASGTASAPVSPTVTYTVPSPFTVYYYVDNTQVGSKAASSGANQWVTPSLKQGHIHWQ